MIVTSMIKITVHSLPIKEQGLATPNVAQPAQQNQPSAAQAPNLSVQAKTASASNVNFKVNCKNKDGSIQCGGYYWKDGNPQVCSFSIRPSTILSNGYEFYDLIIDGSQFLDIGLNHKALEFAKKVVRALGGKFVTPAFSQNAFTGTDYEKRAWKQANTSKCSHAPLPFQKSGLDVQANC